MSITKAFFLSTWVILLFSCKNDNTQSNKKLLTSVFNILDTISITKLPLGDLTLVDMFNNLNPTTTPTKIEEKSIDEFTNVINNQISLKRIKKLKFYWPDTTYSLDIDYPLSIPTKSHQPKGYKRFDSYYDLLYRLPNIGKMKVLIFSDERDPYSFDSHNADLIVVDNENNILSRFNLMHLNQFSEFYKIDFKQYNFYKTEEHANILNNYAGSETGCVKYFYIDKNYIIHIKYFITGEFVSNVFASLQYKIQPDGSIVQYFAAGDGYYKDNIERGHIKNHIMDGEWVENFGGGDGVYAKSTYKNGRLIGERKFYKMDGGAETPQYVYSIDTKENRLFTNLKDSVKALTQVEDNGNNNEVEDVYVGTIGTFGIELYWRTGTEGNKTVWRNEYRYTKEKNIYTELKVDDPQDHFPASLYEAPYRLSEENNTGNWVITMKGNGDMTGTWTSPKTQKSYPINLKLKLKD